MWNLIWEIIVPFSVSKSVYLNWCIEMNVKNTIDLSPAFSVDIIPSYED